MKRHRYPIEAMLAAARCYAACPLSLQQIVGISADIDADIGKRQSKYLNKLTEQDHRTTKRVVRPLLGFKAFLCARAITAGIETMHMIKREQLDCLKDTASPSADRFY